MAKADRVHSTPRRTASKSKPLKQRVKSNEAENSARYLAIEPLLCDVYRAAETAHDAVADDKEYASFAAFQLFNMVGDLREMFYGRPVAQKAVA